MFSQFFGSYLLNNGLVSSADLTRAFEEKSKTRPKLGTLAINEGLMNASQVERVNEAQQSVDKRFGDLAVELGYLTDSDVDRLLGKQPTDYLILGQALVDIGALSNDRLEKSISEYKAKYMMDDEDITGNRGDTVSRLISDFYHFGTAENAKISADYVKMLLKNVIRFVGDDFTPLQSFVAGEIESKYIVKQRISGDGYECVTAICTGITEYVEIASRFAKEDFTEVDDFVDASVGELLNVMNGLFAVNESTESGLELTMSPQESVSGGRITFSKPAFCIPVAFGFGEVDFVISAQ